MYVVQNKKFPTMKALKTYLQAMKWSNALYTPVTETKFLKEVFQAFGVDTHRVNSFKVVLKHVGLENGALTVRVFAGFTTSGVRLREFSVSGLRAKNYV